MSDFVNYDSTDIESSLLVDKNTPGLMSKEDKVKLNALPNIWSGTREAYNKLSTKDPSILYVIIEPYKIIYNNINDAIVLNKKMHMFTDYSNYHDEYTIKYGTIDLSNAVSIDLDVASYYTGEYTLYINGTDVGSSIMAGGDPIVIPENLRVSNAEVELLYILSELITPGLNVYNKSSSKLIDEYYSTKSFELQKIYRNGYIFNGWYNNSSFTGSPITQINRGTTGDITLYAKWGGVIYNITYNGNGATSGSTASSSHVYGESKALTSNGFSRTGYTFLGWSTNSSASSATYTNSQSVINLSSVNGATITLYAIWKVNSYTLSLNANGGSVSPTSMTIPYGSHYGSLPTPSRSGYTFNGWYTAATGGSKVSSATTMGAGNTTIYAQWTINTITFRIMPTAFGGNNQVGTVMNFTALPNMTWQSFVNSSYNDGRFSISGNYVKFTDKGITYYIFTARTGTTRIPAALKNNTITSGFTYIIDMQGQVRPSN